MPALRCPAQKDGFTPLGKARDASACVVQSRVVRHWFATLMADLGHCLTPRKTHPAQGDWPGYRLCGAKPVFTTVLRMSNSAVAATVNAPCDHTIVCKITTRFQHLVRVTQNNFTC